MTATKWEEISLDGIYEELRTIRNDMGVLIFHLKNISVSLRMIAIANVNDFAKERKIAEDDVLT